MVSLIWTYLARERPRTAMSIAGVSLAIALLFTLTSIYFGVYQETTLYIDNSGADLWVAQKGTTDFYLTISFLPENLRQSLSVTPGIQKASPMLLQAGILSANGRSQPVGYVGYDPQTGLGGPWHLERGHSVQVDGQAVIDEEVAISLGVDVGGKVQIAGEDFDVVGISSGTSGFIYSYVFFSLHDAETIDGEPGVVSYILVKVAQNATLQSVTSSITTGRDYVTVISTSDFSLASREIVLSQLGPPLESMVLIGDFTAIVIVGLTSYTSSVERRREYGILKAIGMRNRTLFKIVLGQSLLISLVGFALGGLIHLFAVFGLSFFFRYSIPVAYSPITIIILLSSSLQIGLSAGVLPARGASRVDPAIVFR